MIYKFGYFCKNCVNVAALLQILLANSIFAVGMLFAYIGSSGSIMTISIVRNVVVGTTAIVAIADLSMLVCLIHDWQKMCSFLELKDRLKNTA